MTTPAGKRSAQAAAADPRWVLAVLPFENVTRDSGPGYFAAGMTDEYRSRLTPDELEAMTSAIAQSKDATFLSRSVDNDRATMTGVLTGGPSPQPIVIKLVKEGGTWKIDDVTLGVE